MDFSIVKLAGKQFLVSKDSIFDVDANLGKVGDKIVIDQVLLTNVNGEVVVGTPLVAGAKVHTEVVFSGKGEKVRVSKFKAKSRYRITTGFRSFRTTLKVIEASDEKVSTGSGKQPGVSKGRGKKSSPKK